jgi:para-nitrobenzyl esterase
VDLKPRDELVVATRTGLVRGRLDDGVPGFRGIPYAGRVRGAGRFQPAPPCEPWHGVRDAILAGPAALQGWRPGPPNPLNDYMGTGGRHASPAEYAFDEDCLFLNVLTPAVDRGLRPVMVYLHGGSFAAGSGLESAGAIDLVREENVVVVSINHRLNVFGFLWLAHRDPRYARSGNVGMLDIVEALRWVRDNIEAFGGDPANVTIFGSSSGGEKVSLLMAMPAARGLFHRAIVQSGPMVRTHVPEEAAEITDAVLADLGVDGDDISALLSAPADAIEKAALPRLLYLPPIVDGRDLPCQPFSPEAVANSADIPLLIGYCDEEMTVFCPEDRALAWLGNVVGPDRDRILLDYENLMPARSVPQRALAALTDAAHGRNTHLILERVAGRAAATFSYLYRYPTPLPGAADGRRAAFHSAEEPLVFRHVLHPEMDRLSRSIAAAWAQFARTGDPGLPGRPWPAHDLGSRQTMVWDRESRVESDPVRARRQIWEAEPEIRQHTFPDGWFAMLAKATTAV